jgi:hypothetical protein
MQSNLSSTSKVTLWQKIKAIIFSLAIMILVFWSIKKYLDYDEYSTQEEVLANPEYVKGIITQKRTYKGKGVDIDYFVKGEKLQLSTGISTEFSNLYQVGDSVEIVYSKRNPSIAILRYDLNIVPPSVNSK